MDIPGLLLQYKYLAVFLASIAEGPMVSIASGFFYRLGVFNFFLIYILLMLGDLIRDSIWYLVGRYRAHNFIARFGKFFSLDEATIDKVKGIFLKHDAKILFISKVTMGLGFAIAVLLVAGMSKIPFRKYLVLNFLGTLVWSLLLIMVGYHFGSFYTSIARGFRDVFIAFVVITIALALYGFGKYLKRRIQKNNLEKYL